jgi:hypothetical protein
MRVVVRRERPHPGAQISVFEAHDDWRYQAFATDTPAGQLAWLEARHRAHARVEDKIKTIKQAGLGRFPSHEFQINQVWLQLALTAAPAPRHRRNLGSTDTTPSDQPAHHRHPSQAPRR